MTLFRFETLIRLGAVTLKKFRTEQKGVAAVEFSLNALALLMFFFAIINLGDLGMVLSTMKHGVQSAARNATVATGVSMSQSGNGGSCATTSQIVTDFNNIASPILPQAASSANGGAPVVQTSWINNIYGASLTVTANYQWAPIGMPNNLGTAVPLSASSTQMVLGTSGANTTCN